MSDLTSYYNNNRYCGYKNNVNNNSNNNNHDSSLQDYYNNSVLTRSKLYAATKRNTKDDTLVNSNNKDKKIEKTPIIIPAVTTTIVLFLKTTMISIWMATKSVPPTPTPSDSNVDNTFLRRYNKNNVTFLPRFIGHPNGKEMETETDQRPVGAKQRSIKQHLPSFTSHLTGIVLYVL